MEPFQGQGEVGGIMPIGVGTENYLELDLQPRGRWTCLRGWRFPLNERDLGKTLRAHPFGMGA